MQKAMFELLAVGVAALNELFILLANQAGGHLADIQWSEPVAISFLSLIHI